MAGQLFFAAHDSFGEPEVHPDVVAVGLGAALLAELMLVGRVTSRDGLLMVVDTAAPSDDLANTVLARVRAEQQLLPVSDWVAALALDAVAEMSNRLVKARQIRVERPRQLRTLGLTRVTRFVPVDTVEAAAPAARIADTIRRGEYLHVVDAVLAGLMVAMGLHHEVLNTWDPGIEQHIRYQVAQLVPVDVQDLISRTEAVVGAGVLIR
ncbi:GPP34 family phosphoprotein [Actinoplanes sp. NPDC049265]|uniref:GOLPH3/VPS74 family protein n=1 Tax=Actinoplanes sp. NPDC049265 TaxID=3363902 RepID=UPI00370F9EFD